MFLFTHIEKCAGTTFNEILSLTFPRYFHITKNNYGGNEKRNDLTHEEYKKILRFYPSGIGGHSIRPYLEFLPSSKRITFLRDPLSRYISHFNHMLERGWTTSFDDYLTKDFFHDFITKKIAGSSDLKYAIELLSDFYFIGDADEFNRSLNYLQDVLDVKLIGQSTYTNQRSTNAHYLKLSDLTSNQKQKAEENNQLDIKLYNKFIIQNSPIRSYSDIVELRSPSKLRVKVIQKINKFKKEKIVNPIREAEPKEIKK